MSFKCVYFAENMIFINNCSIKFVLCHITNENIKNYFLEIIIPRRDRIKFIFTTLFKLQLFLETKLNYFYN